MAGKHWNESTLPIDIVGISEGQSVRWDGSKLVPYIPGGGTSPVDGLIKLDKWSPCIVKTGGQTASIKAGTVFDGVSFAVDTPITMPTLTAGEDYSVWVHPDGTASAVAETDYSSPTVSAAPPVSGAKCIGGFHYGLVPHDATVASGGFATSGGGHHWVQADVDKIRGINAFSIWDLSWRANTDDLRAQRGFAYVPPVKKWVAIYMANTDTDANGLSGAGTNMLSGTVAAKRPARFGGDGTATYNDTNWYACSEIAAAYGARLMWETEFQQAAYGVTEAQSIGGANATYPTTERNAGYTSLYGIEQASGHHYTWGADTTARVDSGTTSGEWRAVTAGRGSVWSSGTNGQSLIKVRLGGGRTGGSVSGSRCSLWSDWPWRVLWGMGLRAACDHLQLGA